MTLWRELAYRHQDGLEVTLFWQPSSNEVSIELVDDRNGRALAFAVEGASALDAFHHPFAYAPAADVDVEEAPALAGLTYED